MSRRSLTLTSVALVLLLAAPLPAVAGEDWKADEAAGAGLSAAAKGCRIFSRLHPDGKPEYKVAVPVGGSLKDARTYAGVKSVRGTGHYLAVEAGDYVQYYDLREGVHYTVAGERREDFKLVATVIENVLRSAQAPSHPLPSAMLDFDVLRDAMARYLGGSPAVAETAVLRIQDMSRGAPYRVAHASAELVLIEDAHEYYSVWPDYRTVPKPEHPLLRPIEQENTEGFP